MAIVTFRNYKSGQTRGCMSAVMKYTKRKEKVEWEDKQLVTGINCRPATVYEDFMRTKQIYHKEGGVLFYHMVQSFPKGADVDPKAAHAAAVELAGYFKDYEVLVCTHTDREHVHSHFVINSVNFETGKKLHMADEQIQELRQRNDMVCERFHLPVFESAREKKQEKKIKPMTIGEYHVAAKGQSWKFRLMATVDECMGYAKSREEFIALMQSEGYDVRWTDTRKYITYTAPDGNRCRDNKLHEEKYLKENMENEFKIRQRILDAEVFDGRAESDESPRPDSGERVRNSRHADREELVGSGEPAREIVFDAGYDPGNARRAADEAGRGRTARADRALDADAAPAVESDGGAVRAASESDERPLRRKVKQPASEFGRVSPEAGKLDEEYAARYDERDARTDQRTDRISAEMADAPRDDVAPAVGRAGDHLRDRHAAETVSEAAIGENSSPPAETGWEKERESFLANLAEGRTMAHRKAASSHTDQHGASERFDPPREYVRGEPSGKRRTSSVLNQTSQILSSAGHALSGDGDEAVVILGALAGAAVGLAIGAAEKRSQTAAQQTEAPRDDPPQSAPTEQAEAPHNDSSQPASAQLSMEPQQEPASQQIEQPMEQSM
ncbi:MAG: hypothetical protein E7474_09685 [Ruminococcaceae bacterium]|nr:hypothetical protein [Oscillospiraceae bacterium]